MHQHWNFLRQWISGSVEVVEVVGVVVVGVAVGVAMGVFATYMYAN